MRIVPSVGRLILLLALVSPLAAAGPGDDGPPQTAPAAIGQPVPDHTFPKLDRHDGRATVSSLYGHPVLVVGWRQFIPDGLHAVWYASKLAKKYADDGLIVILEDRDKWTKNDWWATRSFWVRLFNTPVWFAAGQPGKMKALDIVRRDSKIDVQSLVLIGVDGRLLAEGTALSASIKEKKGDVRRRIRTAIKRELERRKKGWGDDPHVRKARALAFGKGRFAAALQSVERSAASDGAKQAVADRIVASFDAACKSVRFLEKRGRVLEAEERWKALKEGARGHESFEAKVDALASLFTGPKAAKAKKGARSVAKLLRPLRRGKWRDIDLDTLRRLRKISRRHADNSVGDRAARLDVLVRDLVRVVTKKGVNQIEEALAKSK